MKKDEGEAEEMAEEEERWKKTRDGCVASREMRASRETRSLTFHVTSER